jgi:16S rRNA (cytidine1402-2'-O)-methyltransferase
LQASLDDVLLVLGDRRVAICRELTKAYEEVFRGTVKQAREHFTKPRGEFTLVIEGKGAGAKLQLTPDIEQRLKDLRVSGVTAKEAIARVAEQTGIARKELYRAWLRIS